MIYTQRLPNALNKDVNKGNEICTKATQRVEQRCKQRQ